MLIRDGCGRHGVGNLGQRGRSGSGRLGRCRHRPRTQVGDPLTGHLGRTLPVGAEHADVEGPVLDLGLVEKAGGRILQVPDDVQCGHALQDIPSRVVLPPPETLADGSRQVVVIVVPPLPTGNQSDQERVPTRVRSGIAAATEDVGHGVHQERSVPQQHGRQEEPDQQTAPAEEGQTEQSEGPRPDPVVPLQPAQLGIGSKVLDAIEVGVFVLGGQDPTHVAPPEPVTGRVHVPVEVGIAMVDPMVAGPPKWTLLQCSGAPEGHEELRYPTHLVGAVGEVAVVAGGDAEHPADIEHGAEHPVLPGHIHEEGGQRGQVHQEERNGRHPVSARFIGRGGRSRSAPGSCSGGHDSGCEPNTGCHVIVVD